MQSDRVLEYVVVSCFRAFADEGAVTTLVSKNLMIGKRRTSSRLEPSMWDAFTAIAAREEQSIHTLATRVDGYRQESSLTSSIRIFILMYFRMLAQSAEAGDIGQANRARVAPFLDQVLEQYFGVAGTA